MDFACFSRILEWEHHVCWRPLVMCTLYLVMVVRGLVIDAGDGCAWCSDRCWWWLWCSDRWLWWSTFPSECFFHFSEANMYPMLVFLVFAFSYEKQRTPGSKICTKSNCLSTNILVLRPVHVFWSCRLICLRCLLGSVQYSVGRMTLQFYLWVCFLSMLDEERFIAFA